jgi:hypothetical protein
VVLVSPTRRFRSDLGQDVFISTSDADSGALRNLGAEGGSKRPGSFNPVTAANRPTSTLFTLQRQSARAQGSIGSAWAMPTINENLKHDESIAASLARLSGMNQIIVLPVIENALLKAVLA